MISADIEMANMFTELSEILKYTSIEVVNKIPSKLKNKIEQYKNKEYKFKYNPTLEIEEQKIMPITKTALSTIYLEYCCDSEKKNELLKICNQNDMNFQNQHADYDDMFKKQKQSNTESTEMIVVKRTNIIEKILGKIKRILRRKE